MHAHLKVSRVNCYIFRVGSHKDRHLILVTDAAQWPNMRRLLRAFGLRVYVTHVR